MSNPQIGFFCCDKHNETYIEARRRSRASGVDWTLEETDALNAIQAHLRELSGRTNASPMFTVDGIRNFHAWTHASLDLLFDHLNVLSASEYTKDLPGFGYASVHAQVIHLLGCEARWVRRLRSQPTGEWNPAQWPALVDARKLQRGISAQTFDYLTALTDHQLNSNTTLHFPEGDTAVRTPVLVLHHVFTHAFHHKGQIVAMCRILGHPTPDTDLNQFE